MEYFSELSYIGLFIAALLAATILPLSSEVVLSALLLSGLSPALLIMVATAGNVSGALLNYALGYWANVSLIQKWLRMPEDQLLRTERRFKSYGTFSLLFAWVPIIGDPLTIIAGILRIHLSWFLLLVTIGKLIRYIAISYIALQVS